MLASDSCVSVLLLLLLSLLERREALRRRDEGFLRRLLVSGLVKSLRQ